MWWWKQSQGFCWRKHNSRPDLHKFSKNLRAISCVVLCIVYVSMCTVLLPPGVKPTAVNKYIKISNIKIIGTRKAMWGKPYTEVPQKLGTILQNFSRHCNLVFGLFCTPLLDNFLVILQSSVSSIYSEVLIERWFWNVSWYWSVEERKEHLWKLIIFWDLKSPTEIFNEYSTSISDVPNNYTTTHDMYNAILFLLNSEQTQFHMLTCRNCLFSRVVRLRHSDIYIYSLYNKTVIYRGYRDVYC